MAGDVEGRRDDAPAADVAGAAAPEAVRGEHKQILMREFLASALYVDFVLLAALAVTPKDHLPSDRDLVLILLGTAVGLMAAHWFAFRVAAHVASSAGQWEHSASEEAAAQVAGGVAVAVAASVPFMVADDGTALRWSLFVLAALPAVAGHAIGRLRGRSHTRSAIYAVVILIGAGAVVAIKIATHH